MLAGQLSMWVSWPCTLPFESTKLWVTVLKTPTRVIQSFQPIYGRALLYHVYQTLKLPGSIYCLRVCDDDIRCQSINHVVHGEICELNNRTKEARPEAFTTDDTKVYMKKFKKRGGWRRFAKSLSLFSHKTWVPGYIFHEGSTILFRLGHHFWKNVMWRWFGKKHWNKLLSSALIKLVLESDHLRN